MYSVLFSFFFSADREKFKLPKTLDEAKDLGRVLSNYKDDFFLHVVLGFMITYILYPFLCMNEQVILLGTCSFFISNSFTQLGIDKSIYKAVDLLNHT